MLVFLLSVSGIIALLVWQISDLAKDLSQMEQKMLQLLDELEDYSGIHREAIDAAIMKRHNARLAYWQAKLDEAALTGEAVQQH